MTRLNLILTIVLALTALTVFGQTEQKNKRFDEFIKLFPKIELPDTIQYSGNEFDYGYYTPDEDENDDEDSTNNHKTKDTTREEYQNSVLPKDYSLNLNYGLVKLFLLADTEIVTPIWPENNPQPDTIFPTYYISSRVTTNKNFVCLIYERQFIFGSGANPYAEKFLCTLTKTGKLIDKILVASADYSGTGILDDGFRVPWFPDEKSIVNKDLTINYFKNGYNFSKMGDNGVIFNLGDIIYQIDNNGKIKKQKQ